MITGDHKATAGAIARELGLRGTIISGAELDALDDAALAACVNDTAVFARVSPTHKVRIVRALKALGHVVAMTGDGVNDAPALKAADIGVAMGITGTAVTGEAATLLGWPAPFTAIHLLWINIIMDGPPAMTLGIEPARPGIMGDKPRSEHSTVFNKNFFTNGKLWLALGGVLGMQVLAVHWGPAQSIFDTVDLTLDDWLLAITVASAVLLLDEGYKFLTGLAGGKLMTPDASGNSKE